MKLVPACVPTSLFSGLRHKMLETSKQKIAVFVGK